MCTFSSQSDSRCVSSNHASEAGRIDMREEKGSKATQKTTSEPPTRGYQRGPRNRKVPGETLRSASLGAAMAGR